ncbi:MAG: YiiX/YebB-like N1pC/P60 family cysteine hydrolase, partial [Chloroflexota bacterium]
MDKRKKVDTGAMQAGDIILFHGTSLVSRLIQFGANSFWNHGVLYVGEAWERQFVIEAAFQGVRVYPLQEYDRDKQLVLRPVEPVGASVVQAGLKYLGRRYDFESYPALFLRVLRMRFPWLPYRVRGEPNPFFYCFELVAQAYKDVGFPLTTWELVLPQYLIDAVAAGRLTVVSGGL